jgi:hypothetical protein
MKKTTIFGVIGLMSVFLASPVLAAEALFPQKDSGNVVIGEGQSHHNLYVAGGNVTVHATTTGDLFAGGGSITITGVVEEDLVVAGGNISIGGPVGGDARIAGGNITITAPINGDLLIGGGTVTITSPEGIGGDVWIGGGSVVINAPIKGNVRIGGGEVLLNGPIGGSIEVNAERLTFGSNASATGTISYHGLHEAVVEEGAMVGQIDFQERAAPKGTARFTALITIGFLVQLLAWIVAAGVLYLFARRALSRAVGSAYNAPWKSLTFGLVGVIVWPIVIVLLFVTLIGYYLALLLLALFVFFVLVSALLGAIMLGSLLIQWVSRAPVADFRINWLSIVVGVIVVSLLPFVPIVGWVIAAGVFLIAFGTLLRLGHQIIARERLEEEAQPPLPL